MTHEQLWQAFMTENQNIDKTYEAFRFGMTAEQADRLAMLVATGVKTATSSAYIAYALDGEMLPEVDTYSIVLNAQDEAVCIIKNTKVYVQPFNQVSADHAFKEGEGDRSLAYWRKEHEHFFKTELGAGQFSEDMLIVCEEFVVVYKA